MAEYRRYVEVLKMPHNPKTAKSRINRSNLGDGNKTSVKLSRQNAKVKVLCQCRFKKT